MSYTVVLYTCNYFQDWVVLDTLAEAHAFMRGASMGGGYFGDGVAPWILPHEMDMLQEFLDDEFTSEATRESWKNMRSQLPEGTFSAIPRM